MSVQQTNTTSEPDEYQFFQALMAHIMEGAMIPKVQVERAIGPIIGFFLAEALSEEMGENVISLCPEFPILKARVGASEAGNNQSTNIDWLMFNLDSKEIILLELKTTDTTFKPDQASTYKRLQASISEQNSAEFLITDLIEISAASLERGKYQHVLKLLENVLPNIRDQFSQCNTAKVIYLAPQVTKPKNWDEAYPGWRWLSFRDLPENIEHTYATHWHAVRQSLQSIDDLTKRIRNSDDIIASKGKNYRYLYNFETLLERCRTDGKSIVVGFANWRKILPSTDMAQLQSKTYKCDSKSNGLGKKIDRNWISGDEFLSKIDKLRNKACQE